MIRPDRSLERKLPIDRVPHSIVSDHQLRTILDQQMERAAGIEAHFEALVLQRFKQPFDRPRRRHRSQHPRHTPPDNEIAVRVEQSVYEHSGDAGAHAFQCAMCGRHDFVPRHQIDQERSEIPIVGADLVGGGAGALRLRGAKIGGPPQK